MGDKLKFFAGQSNPELAKGIAAGLGLEPGAIEFVRFSNENIKVKICENVRGCDVFFLQTSCPPVNEYLMELLIALDALKFASARRITAVLPYYPYALADSKDEPRISVAARLMADLITEAGASRILTMTLHSPQIMGFCRIPIDQLSGVPTICDAYAQMDLKNCVAVSPDISRAKVTEAYAKRLGLPLVVVDKRRTGKGKTQVNGVIGEVEGRDAIFLDDEIITGASIIEGAQAVRDRGARRIFAGCVHGTMPGQSAQRIAESDLERLVITDTIPLPAGKQHPKIAVQSVAPLFANAIKAIHEETSISSFFK
ncbi:MAG: ribose-phosphate diphosphokinase [Candidatus Latescibacteria bacterium]|nr:ribose-phosphate diphosphokinase [Candidatus Latescibacterota bacterium]